MSRLGAVLERLEAVIGSRRGADPSRSWSARLLADPTLAARKLGEEALETVLAAAAGDREALVAESADLLYHWLALIAALGVTPDQVADELERREGRSGVEEKGARGEGG